MDVVVRLSLACFNWYKMLETIYNKFLPWWKLSFNMKCKDKKFKAILLALVLRDNALMLHAGVTWGKKMVSITMYLLK